MAALLTQWRKPRQAWACGILAFLLLLASVGLYTPLHVHLSGKPYQCSFHNLDHQWADGTVAVLALPALLPETHGGFDERCQAAPWRPIQQRVSRGPPSAVVFS